MRGLPSGEPGRGRLSLGTDPLGLQPLYYREDEGALLFGERLSEVARPGGEKLHLASCEHFLRFLTVPPGRTLIGGVRRVPPGERLLCPGGAEGGETLFPLRREAAPGRAQGRERILGALRESLRAASEEAGEAEPLGLLLSGGTDSTALLALLRESRRGPIAAIHAAPAGSPDREFARAMAARHGTEFLDVVLTARDAEESLGWIVASMEAPSANASAVATCRALALARERGVRRLISGLGSDEVFCGHAKHLLAPWWPALALLPRALRRIAPGARRGGPWSALREALAAEGGPAEMHRAMYALLGERESGRLRGSLARLAQAAPPPWRAPEDAGFPSGLNAEILQVDLNLWLRGALAPMAGALAAANGIELMLPFCAPELWGLSASIPLSWKVSGRSGKRILREAIAGIVPREVLRRPRQGFTVPVSEWLRGELARSAEELLAPRRVERWCLLEPGGPMRLLREHAEGRADWGLPLWGWMTFALWYERFVGDGGGGTA